jgi:hypothetical protein
MARTWRWVGCAALAGLAGVGGCKSSTRGPSAPGAPAAKATPVPAEAPAVVGMSVTDLGGAGKFVACAPEPATRAWCENLKRLGLPAERPTGGSVITSATPAGRRFTLIVAQASVPGTPGTACHVALEWANRAEGEEGWKELSALEAKRGVKARGQSK